MYNLNYDINIDLLISWGIYIYIQIYGRGSFIIFIFCQMQSNDTNLRRVYETEFQGEYKTKLNQFWQIKGMNQKFNVLLWHHILILSLLYLRYLTHCWYSAFPPLIGLHSLQLYFSRHNCPSQFYLFVGKLFPSYFLMLRSLRSFVITSLITLLD